MVADIPGKSTPKGTCPGRPGCLRGYRSSTPAPSPEDRLAAFFATTLTPMKSCRMRSSRPTPTCRRSDPRTGVPGMVHPDPDQQLSRSNESTTTTQSLARSMPDSIAPDRDFLSGVAGSTASPEDQVLARERRQTLAGALARLTARQRSVVMLSHCDGLTSSEVSALTGWNPSTVRVQLFRGLRTLRLLLGEAQPGRFLFAGVSRADKRDFFTSKRVRCVARRRLQVVAGQPWIRLKHIAFGGSFADLAER